MHLKKHNCRIPALFIAMQIVLLLAVSPAQAWFATGQPPALMLSGFGFNNAGYLNSPGDGLMFNHPMNISTDGSRLALCDTRNNRVLIWNSLPTSNTSPDLVLGQPDLVANNPGDGMGNLNWPAGVTIGGGKMVVADTENGRLLIWNSLPIANGQAADLYIDYKEMDNPKKRIEWPWDVWTDGNKLIATCTQVGRSVLIWNSFPTTNNQPADLYLRASHPQGLGESFGTPRTIGTDGSTYLVIGDHNAANVSNSMGSFFWNSFPVSDNQPFDFFMGNPFDNLQMMWGGAKTPAGQFITVAPPGLALWNSVPTSPVPPDMGVGNVNNTPDSQAYIFNSGDGSDLTASPGGELFISLYNANLVAVYNSTPTSAEQRPDFALGSNSLDVNTLDERFIITNPVPAANGSTMLVMSDFDRKLYVWRNMPDSNGVQPDAVYDLDKFAPSASALFEDKFVLAGKDKVMIWSAGLPTGENQADLVFERRIGSVLFREFNGVALDGKYLYLSDAQAGKIYVWASLPSTNSSPLFTLNFRDAADLSSDGTYLTVTTYNGPGDKVAVFRVADLGAGSSPIMEIQDSSEMPIEWPKALAAGGHLFISNPNNNAVYLWESIERAISGAGPDAILGQQSRRCAIGGASLFRPTYLAFHGQTLWVGEFKFSGRLLGFKY